METGKTDEKSAMYSTYMYLLCSLSLFQWAVFMGFEHERLVDLFGDCQLQLIVNRQRV